MSDIFTWIKEQEVQYSQEIEVMENWSWNMKEHIRTSILFKHGKFKDATNDLKLKQPFKNVIYPSLNLRYRAEDIDMKDVVLYVDSPQDYHLSFLVKKYHDEVYVAENDLDTFFDETKEEKIDLGGTLVRKGKDGPVFEPLDSIVFCDQTDILSGPIGFKMFFAPDELYEMEKLGWGNPQNGADISLDNLITLADEAKQQDIQQGVKTKTPGKYIEVYRIHGSFPASWLEGVYKAPEKERYLRQMHIIGYYKNKEGISTGVTLYKAREFKNPFKLHLSGKKIRNRALAFGGVEELFDPQIWTNYSEIKKKNILDAAGTTILQTNDESYANRNQIKEMENLEITVTKDGGAISRVETGNPNVVLFNEWIQEWDTLGKTTSGATDALLGKNPSSGTPFRLENLVAYQGQGLHDYRKGKFATFIAEIYTDWIIPDIQRKITSGATFLATLSSDEMEYVSDCVVRSQTNKYIVNKILDGEVIFPEEVEAYKQKIAEGFARGGNKKFLEILKGEFKDKTLRVKINVAGKQKDLMLIVDKMVNVFRQVLANPAVLQDPKAAKVFNKLIEYSGLDPIDFGYATAKPSPVLSPLQPQPKLPAPVPTSLPQ